MMLCVWILVSVVGCSKEKTETQPNNHEQGEHTHQTTAPSVYPPMVMIDGKLYRDDKLEAKDAFIAESEIEGRITFTIKSSNKPSRNNEANYARAHNAPYARWVDATYGEVYVLQYGGKWYILLPLDHPAN